MKVCVSSLTVSCPGTSKPNAAHLTVWLFLCCKRRVEGPWWVPCQLKKSFNGLRRTQGSRWKERKRKVSNSPMRGHLRANQWYLNKKEAEKMQLVARPDAYCEGLAWLFAWLYAKEQTGNIGGPRTHNPIIYGKSTKTLLKVSYMPSSWKARLHLERCHIRNFLLRHLFFSDFKVLEIGKTAAGAPPRLFFTYRLSSNFWII